MRFFNTASGIKEEFSKDSKKLGLYICGPTVYSETHLGHAKSYVSFDILKRWLTYKGYHVTHIQNFTDVSDETAEGALREGVDEFTFTQKYEKEFLDNMALLSNTYASKYTRASEFVVKIAEETKKLLESGEAYQTDKGVFVRINQDDHGKLLRVNLEESLAECTSDVDSGPKESPHDTLLWGPPLEGGNSWEVDRWSHCQNQSGPRHLQPKGPAGPCQNQSNLVGGSPFSCDGRWHPVTRGLNHRNLECKKTAILADT